jgi:ribosomal subunit interface protein
MEITFKGRHTSVPERFRRHATAKLAKLERLDQKVIRIDVEVSKERNPRQSDRSERVELTIRSRGPAIRAEAAADDRYAALDLAFAKLDARLRRASERRKTRHDFTTVRSADATAAVSAAGGAADATAAVTAVLDEEPILDVHSTRGRRSKVNGRSRPETVVSLPEPPEEAGFQTSDFADFADDNDAEASVSGLVPIQMEGEGPLVVREKVHLSRPMTIDQALLEMELVGHDFYLFHDSECDRFSVVYRRRGYDYGVIRLVEE